MKIVVLIQARMGSSRLPGKVLLDIAGKPMIMHVADRSGQSRLINDIVVATSTNEKDDAIEAFCSKQNLKCYRGSEDDIVDRLFKAARAHRADIVLRVWGDCPLIDPFLIDKGISLFIKEEADYLNNFFPQKSFPHGFEFEVYSVHALEDIEKTTRDNFFREFPFEYIGKNKDRFKSVNLKNGRDLSQSGNFTVDYPQDVEVISSILQHFSRYKKKFGFEDVVAFCKGHKEVVERNKNLERDIEYKKQLLKRKDIGNSTVRR